MRRLPVAAVVIVLAFGLAGCAGGDGYSTATARRLQQTVLDIATSAEGADYTDALGKLTALEELNDADATKGLISAGRHDAIARSIAVIRTDLTELKSAADTAALRAQLQELQAQQEQKAQQPAQPPQKKGGPPKGKGDK